MQKGKTKLGKIHSLNYRLEHHEVSWMSMAYELKRTEELIYFDIIRTWDQIKIERLTGNYKPCVAAPDKVYFLIIGLAIENLLKCIFLNRHPEIINEAKIDDKRFKSHNLINIACDDLKLKLNKDEKFLCDLGTKAIKWFGRYPMPLKQSETFIAIETNKSEIHLAFHQFFERLVTITKGKPVEI